MNSFNCLDSSEKNGNYFRGMVDGLEDEDNIEEMNCNIGKKKRLGIDQVQALERIFEADNKLDPEKKTKLAQELGLQPRQVAIWFQNRRARWKTKQLERDYRLLKSNYEALHLNYSKVEHEKASLVTELRGLKEKLGEENEETKNSANKASSSQSPHPQSILTGKFKDSTHETEPNREIYNTNINFKEGLSDDSGSSGILNNEDNYLNTHPMISMENSVFSLSTPFYHHNPPLMDSRSGAMIKAYQQQNVFTVDDSCNMLLTDQTPLFWYFSDQRN